MHFINLAGGKCSSCGYKKNLAALVFHHREGKVFSLDARNMSNRTLDAVKAEIAKCKLLCANCHAELHYPHLSEWDV